MKCPICGEETKGVDHNNRGLRCTACWAPLPDEPLPVQAAPPVKAQAKPKPKRRRKAAATRTA